MLDPLFWLGLSILLVAVSLTAVLVAALPAFRELSRAARSAEKLFDTLSRDLPPTLEAIRLTGLEITELTDDVSQSVEDAGRVVRQVDESLSSVRQRAKKAQGVTRSLFVGVRAAWQTLTQPSPPPRPVSMQRSSADRLPASTSYPAELDGLNDELEDDTNAGWFDGEDYTAKPPRRSSAFESAQQASPVYEAWYEDDEGLQGQQGASVDPQAQGNDRANG
ncbi:DUF948 domain-containing protein [Leptolyngbya sp. AN02str]|uniref:DUF948 domain-containing protein n=1 Tax=Leptolyngbya sp. AN02str TaxID=3423363 RepID=UPI003D31E393